MTARESEFDFGFQSNPSATAMPTQTQPPTQTAFNPPAPQTTSDPFAKFDFNA